MTKDNAQREAARKYFKQHHWAETSPQNAFADGFNAGLAANAERVKELEAEHISPKLLLEDLQERHEALMDNYPADENDPVVPYCDGQRYVLERLLSDVQAGLWKVKFE